MEYIVKLRHKDGSTIITPYYNYLQYHEWGVHQCNTILVY